MYAVSSVFELSQIYAFLSVSKMIPNVCFLVSFKMIPNECFPVCQTYLRNVLFQAVANWSFEFYYDRSWSRNTSYATVNVLPVENCSWLGCQAETKLLIISVNWMSLVTSFILYLIHVVASETLIRKHVCMCCYTCTFFPCFVIPLFLCL